MTAKAQRPQPAKVIHVLNGFAFGGVENLCLQILKQSPPEMINYLVNLDPQQQDMNSLFINESGAVLVDIPYHPAQRWQFISQLWQFFRKVRPNAAVIYPFGLHIFVGLAARLAGIQSIVVHAGNVVPQPSEQQKLWKRLIQLSKLLRIPIYSCSTAVQQSLESLATLPKGSTAVLNGCDIDDIARRSRQSRPYHIKTDLVIGMVARLNEIKDQRTLIHAFSLLQKSYSNLQLWIIGEGEQRGELEQLCRHLELQDKVKFWGNRADVPELLGQMDIYAFSTTEAEGFGIALIEAMAASLPIVASSVAACQEVLDDGKAGLLVPPKDAQAMASALEQLIASPQEREKLGDRAYSRAVEHYSIQACAQRWYDLLLN